MLLFRKLPLSSVYISTRCEFVRIWFLFQIYYSIFWFPERRIQTIVSFDYWVQLRNCLSIHYKAPSKPRSNSKYTGSRVKAKLLEEIWNQRNSPISLRYYKKIRWLQQQEYWGHSRLRDFDFREECCGRRFFALGRAKFHVCNKFLRWFYSRWLTFE